MGPHPHIVHSPTCKCSAVLRLAALLTRFPLPRGSAEGEVIASSIAARCWLSERQVCVSSLFPFSLSLVAACIFVMLLMHVLARWLHLS